MTSNLFDGMGLGNLDIAYLFIGILVIILILFIIVFVQMWKLNKLKKRYEKFMKGKEAESLEEEIVNLFEDITYLKETTNKNSKEISRIYKKHESAYQKIGIVKYDAFNQMGGKLSFSLALLNENDDGFILNSVHSSDGCYSYTKEITAGECEISLGEEEKNALEIAINGKPILRKKEK
ncbi:MAG: DUF4446 family protein [Lachnospiraceae bacterium]|nr:DUF4446 family protein [Lachnospiraceae bacterium]